MCDRAARTTTSSVGPNGTRCSPIRCDPTRPRIRVSQRRNTTAERRCASTAGSWAQPLPSGPKSSGLIRADSPWPMTNGSTPNAWHMGSYSSFGSPRISTRYPKSVIRNRNALLVADLPPPGLPKHMTFGLVTDTWEASTQPSGSA